MKIYTDYRSRALMLIYAIISMSIAIQTEQEYPLWSFANGTLAILAIFAYQYYGEKR